jgi:hypothetical protein
LCQDGDFDWHGHPTEKALVRARPDGLERSGKRLTSIYARQPCYEPITRTRPSAWPERSAIATAPKARASESSEPLQPRSRTIRTPSQDA